MLPKLIVVIIAIILVSLILIFFNPIRSFFEKQFFAFSVAKKIDKIARDRDYYVIHKVAIKVEGKVIHFDHILFGDKYIYCINSKYYSVGLTGKFTDSSWFHYKRNNKFEIVKNPMRIHRERINYFSSSIGASRDLFLATFVVNDSCLIDDIEGASRNDVLINLKSLPSLINKFENNPNVENLDAKALYNLVQEVDRCNIKEG